MNEVDKAELIQGLKAFLIPTCLFISCLLGAAGIFLIREGYGVGWGFIAATVTIMVASFAAFINFQNKLRYEGKMVDPYDELIPEAEASEPSALEQSSEVKAEPRQRAEVN